MVHVHVTIIAQLPGIYELNRRDPRLLYAVLILQDQDDDRISDSEP